MQTVTNVQRAIRDGMSPAALLAVAAWNGRNNRISLHNRFMETETRRPARARMAAQAKALRAVAGELELQGDIAWLEAA